MGPFDDGITVLDFDEIYTCQKELIRCFSYDWIDLKKIHHTNLYCEKQSLEKISLQLKLQSHHNITLIGSGNYHYISYLLLSKIKKPFTLLLFDHHTDMMTTSILSCGSWLSEALLRLPYLKKAIIIGASSDVNVSISPEIRSKVVICSKSDVIQSNFKNDLLSYFSTEYVYISIDKDVLNEKYASTNWEQGEMSMQTLLGIVEYMMLHKQVCGVDVCGELPNYSKELFNPTYLEAIKKNENSNRIILNTLRIPYKRKKPYHASNRCS